MSAQIGTPQYKDLMNKEYLEMIKNKINKLCIYYGKLANNEAINNRESDNFNEYTKQYYNDISTIRELCGWSQQLLNNLNDLLFTISTRSIQNHILPE